MIDPTGIQVPKTSANVTDASRIREVAEQLEASFLAEMLKSAGVGEPSESFGGGAGEEHFRSFLLNAQSEAMVRTGGIGLTEAFVKSLMEAENDRA